MKRSHGSESEHRENPRVDAFLAEIEQVCRKHGMSIGHEDGHGSFLVREQLSEYDIEWLKGARVEEAT
jgi:hypothetical protein